MLPEMELIEADFLEGGKETETQWRAKIGFSMKTKFFAETTFLIHLGLITVLLGLKPPQRWSVQLTDLTDKEI